MYMVIGETHPAIGQSLPVGEADVFGEPGALALLVGEQQQDVRSIRHVGI